MALDSLRRVWALIPAAAARFWNQALNKIKAGLFGKSVALNDEFSVRLSG